MHRRCRLLNVIICFALDIVTTEVCRCDLHTQDFQAFKGVPGHAVTQNPSGGPIMIPVLVAICLFACSRTSLRPSSLILRLKPIRRTQSPRCNESRMCRFVIVLVWRGESRALAVMDAVTAIKLQQEEPSDPPRDSS